jgi:predicted Zn-dependent peptidase
VTFALENGLDVILNPDPSLPLVYVSVWYYVGSAEDPPGKSGLAHLVEHMMFQGSIHVGSDRHFALLKEAGASKVMGTIIPDRTNYYEQLPSNQLEVALWLESDRMGFTVPFLSKAALDNQYDVVRSEHLQVIGNEPHLKANNMIRGLLYAPGHPYHHHTNGVLEDIRKSTLEDIQAFMDKWYRPSNAALVIAGDIDVARTRALVVKWFGTLEKKPAPARNQVPPTPITSTKRELVVDPFVEFRRVDYAWHSPPRFGAGDAEMNIVARVLARSASSRLRRRLINERPWATEVSARQGRGGVSSIFQITVDLKPGADLAAVEAVIREEVDLVRTRSITEKERKRAVAELEVDLLRDVEVLEERGELLHAYKFHMGDADGFRRYVADLWGTTVSSIQRYAAGVLVPERRVEVITMPAVRAVPEAQ